MDEACLILEFAISTRTDISSSYKLLASIYKDKGQTEKIQDLIPIAQNLNSSLSGHIVSTLSHILE